LLTGLSVALAAVAFLVAAAVAASAHITPDPPSAPKGAGDQVFTFRVPNEMPTADTVKLTLQLPQDHPIASVDVLAMPGWTSTVQTKHLTTQITTDDGSFSDVASVITWSAGKIAPGQYGEFKILAQGLPTDTNELVFKALQEYDNGQTVAWIETQANAEHPAPTVQLTSGAPDSTTAVTSTPTTAAGSASVAAVKVTKSDSSKGLAIAGLVVGGIGLIVAIVAVVLARRKPAGAGTGA
jgi:uncharacterized protein YcnI